MGEEPQPHGVQRLLQPRALRQLHHVVVGLGGKERGKRWGPAASCPAGTCSAWAGGLGGRRGGSDALAVLAAVSPLFSDVLLVLRPPELLQTRGTSERDGGARLELRSAASPSCAAAVPAGAVPPLPWHLHFSCLRAADFKRLCGGEKITRRAVCEQHAKNNHFALAVVLG